MEKIWLKQYDEGVPATIDIPDISVDRFLIDSAKRFPHNPALIFFNKKITYAELNDMVNRFAAALQVSGFKKGDRIALYLPNCPQFTIAYYGALRAGGIVVPSNPLYVPRELEHQIKDSGATFVVSLSLLYGRLKKVRKNLNLKQVIVTNIKEYFPPITKLLFTLFRENKPDMNGERHSLTITDEPNVTMWFRDFLRLGHKGPAPVKVSSSDTAVLMYTGGTTGVPKGAQLTHRNLVANALQVASWIPGMEDGKAVMMTALPLTHSYSMTVSQNHSIYRGFAQVLIPNARDLTDVLKNLQNHRVTLFPGVPTLYTAINNHPDVKAGKYDLSSIKACISGAAGLPQEVQREFMKITGGKLIEGYGLSEASPVCTVNPLGSMGKIGSIGVPIPNTNVKIVDSETGKKVLPIGEIGELCVRGPQVMKGYWNMPTETANVLRPDENGDVWLHTGDIAAMDEDGYLSIKDRKKDMIIAGGYNIYPNEVEDVLYTHPDILEAAVVGVPHETRGEVVKAFVVLKEGASLTEEELRQWCKQEMRAYMVPKYVEFRDELPKTMVGKILRRQLLEEEKQKSQN